jgi:antitoxin ParD1/3/4
MNVSLTPELERLVAEKVESGMYTSASEVVREGLRLLQERDELRRTRLEELRREIARGVEQADRGELIDGEAVFRELRERNAAAAAQREG